MENSTNLQILIPVYDDWESVGKLLPLIDRELTSSNQTAEILIIDDGSKQQPPHPWNLSLKGINAVRILRLKFNLGSQRAICIALCHVLCHSKCERLLVMDGDGEDSPEDIPRLINELDIGETAHIVFAQRTKRSEGFVFRFFYLLYAVLHWLLIGHSMRVGNFSVMNRECLDNICASPELWNHYAAAVFATRQQISLVPTVRSNRLAGKSKMNFPALVMHGLSALSVFSDRVVARLLTVSVLAAGMTLIGLLLVAAIRLFTDLAIPGWATYTVGLFSLLLVQIVAFIFTFCFLIFFLRRQSSFIPVRDYSVFVKDIYEAWHDKPHLR